MHRTPSYDIKGPTLLIPSALVLDLQLGPLHTWLSLLVRGLPTHINGPIRVHALYYPTHHNLRLCTVCVMWFAVVHCTIAAVVQFHSFNE